MVVIARELAVPVVPEKGVLSRAKDKVEGIYIISNNCSLGAGRSEAISEFSVSEMAAKKITYPDELQVLEYFSLKIKISVKVCLKSSLEKEKDDPVSMWRETIPDNCVYLIANFAHLLEMATCYYPIFK
ncbi:hypothetical protein CW304_24850 [Bacillus sp. UFRGS-B20]|nr:hypothetical protein CW304_24850 [Bacillus sp. UFRGS-B20]